MYQIEYLTDTDRIRKKQPVIMPNIKTLSITRARILVGDENDHITVFDPREIDYLKIEPLKLIQEGVEF